ncbi:MAG: rhomboid family intramembrane serine protease [Acidimicrobiia bacterium]|nr:rhomboid family intramembrane serine protease [Acidimicrobiia bacterium]
MFPTSDEKVPGKGLGVVTILFIAINVLVFLFLQGAGSNESFTYGYAAVPLEITSGEDLTTPQVIETADGPVEVPQTPGPNPIFLTLITSMFMHAGWLHLIGNMLFLWVFGDNVEHTISRGLYVIFYLLAGVVGALAQILIDSDSPIPSLGASGAVSGVLGAYLVLFPRNRVRVFMLRTMATVPAMVMIGMWALFQFINGLGAFAVAEETTGGVAYMAHIGGFVVGLVAGAIARSAGAVKTTT